MPWGKKKPRKPCGLPQRVNVNELGARSLFLAFGSSAFASSTTFAGSSSGGTFFGGFLLFLTSECLHDADFGQTEWAASGSEAVFLQKAGDAFATRQNIA